MPPILLYPPPLPSLPGCHQLKDDRIAFAQALFDLIQVQDNSPPGYFLGHELIILIY